MKIIKAEPIDAKKLTELTIRSKSYWQYTKEQLESWRADLTIAPEYITANMVYKGIDYHKLVGFYAFQPESKVVGTLDFLFVEPENIGKGYGKILLTDALDRIAKLGYKKVRLEADPNAEVFYKSAGFKVIGQLPSSIEGRFLPIMELSLV